MHDSDARPLADADPVAALGAAGSREPMSSAAFADLGEVRANLLEEAILPSPKTVELQRNPTNDATGRFTSRQPHIAESFIANSAISPHSEANLVLDTAALIAARDWFYHTAFKPRPGVFDAEAARRARVVVDLDTIAAGSAAALRRIQDPDILEIAYALDLFVLYRAAVYRLFPGVRELWLEHFLDPGEEGELRDALPELGGIPSDAVILFVAGAPWRYMLLQGPRGYRRTLIDAGRLLDRVECATAGKAVSIRTSLDFYDVRVDRRLALDGVERSAIAAIAFCATVPERVEET